MSGSDENKAVVRRFYTEPLEERRSDVLDELVTEDYVDSTAETAEEHVPGPEGVKRANDRFLDAFGDEDERRERRGRHAARGPPRARGGTTAVSSVARHARCLIRAPSTRVITSPRSSWCLLNRRDLAGCDLVDQI